MEELSELIITPQKGMSDHELSNLCKTYDLLNKARLDFLKGLLSIDDYLDLLSSSGVNVDSYLAGVAQNLSILLGYDITTQFCE
jgi:hypothetical protein